MTGALEQRVASNRRRRRRLASGEIPSVTSLVVNIGDSVEWNNKSGGITKMKRGVIEAVIPAGKRPDIKNCGLSRDHVSYVVRADGRAYWPRVVHLRLAETKGGG